MTTSNTIDIKATNKRIKNRYVSAIHYLRIIVYKRYVTLLMDKQLISLSPTVQNLKKLQHEMTSVVSIGPTSLCRIPAQLSSTSSNPFFHRSWFTYPAESHLYKNKNTTTCLERKNDKSLHKSLNAITENWTPERTKIHVTKVTGVTENDNFFWQTDGTPQPSTSNWWPMIKQHFPPKIIFWKNKIEQNTIISP